MYSTITRGHLRSRVLISENAMATAPWAEELRGRSQHFLVADEHVFSLHGAAVMNELRKHGKIEVILVAEGEDAKSPNEFLKVATHISSMGSDRSSTLVSLGGASTNNMAGFVAATVLRGIRLIHIPTTLLAQLDGAIDFKQAINVDGVKNMLGSFYAPSLIVVDPSFLRTLPERHMTNGLAEGLKHALIQDRELLRFFWGNVGNRSPEFLVNAILRTVVLKAQLLQSNKYDDVELLLQYGHAVAHALESAIGKSLLHGEAVAIGMCVTSEIAKELKICDEAAVVEHYELLSVYGLPTTIPTTVGAEGIVHYMRRDKYRAEGMQMMSFAAAPGVPYTENGAYMRLVEQDTILRGCQANMSRASRRGGV